MEPTVTIQLGFGRTALMRYLNSLKALHCDGEIDIMSVLEFCCAFNNGAFDHEVFCGLGMWAKKEDVLPLVYIYPKALKEGPNSCSNKEFRELQKELVSLPGAIKARKWLPQQDLANDILYDSIKEFPKKEYRVIEVPVSSLLTYYAKNITK